MAGFPTIKEEQNRKYRQMIEGSPRPNSIQEGSFGYRMSAPGLFSPGTGDLVHERENPNTDEVFKPNMPGAVQMSSQISGQEKLLKIFHYKIYI